MAVLVLVVLLLAMTGYSDAATWCVCRTDVSETALQKAIDYACGAGADCQPIIQSGSCYNPNTVKAHCNWAVNSYFQRKGQTTGSCDFSGAATPTNSDPSQSGCTFPSAPGSGGTTPTPPSTGGTGTGTGTGTVAPPGSPGTGTGTGTGTGIGTGTGTGTGTGFTPGTGIIGGGGMGGTGLGPSGTGINTDSSDGGFPFQKTSNFFLLVTLWFSALVFWWS